MPRIARLIFKNAFYHVFNRGINKEPIFLTDQDYKFFLKKFQDLKNKYDHSIYALCLMPNHFHISIQTRKNSISKIMSSISTSYSMYFNRTYKHFGPVFQNRFKSILVEENSYFLKLSQYIYLNPVKDGLVKNPMEYKYSTLREALGKEPLHFLDKDIVRLIGETEQSRREYEKSIMDGVSEDLTDISKLFEIEESILGGKKFATFAHKKLQRRINKKG
ncbi:MAG: transposase [bacterium]|nr:transposase [bacterium]